MILTGLYILFIITKILMGQGQDVVPMSLGHILTLIGLDIIIYQNCRKNKRKLVKKK